MEPTKFEERLARIMQAAHASTDTDLANALGIKPPSVAAARKRGQIPSGWVEKIAEEYKESADWLLFGAHPEKTDSQDANAPQAGPLGKRLRSIWKKSGLKQEEFARTLDVHTATLINYLSGKRLPTTDFVALLSKVYNVDPGWLILGASTATAVGTNRYRDKFYWCVLTEKGIKKDESIHLYADRVTINGGALEFWETQKDGPDLLTMSFAPGHWTQHYAASPKDGKPCKVEHWKLTQDEPVFR